MMISSKKNWDGTNKNAESIPQKTAGILPIKARI
jgi:hypothetical protein